MPTTDTLYDPQFEHDACGVGFIANIGGQSEHRILAYALQALGNLAHRGALDADAMTGDGCGVLTQLPRAFFQRELERTGKFFHVSDLAAGVLFMPRGDEKAIGWSQQLIEAAIARFGFACLGWRTVPVDPSSLGEKARATMPEIRQVFVLRTNGCDDAEFERRLLLVRKTVEREASHENLRDLYIPSFSSRTIVYKGLLRASQLGEFYPDLRDPLFATALAIFHQRYSTNTFPNWRLAHPFRVLAHNGEINTLSGNKAWTRARESELTSPVWGEHVELLKPILQAGGSDSSCLDNVLELLQMSGRDVLHSVMMLAPEAWENNRELAPERAAFYRFHACLNEPWDGPAALVFSDGRYIGAKLDRNGLRPARYKIYADGLMVLASEAGVLPLDEQNVVAKGRLGPGRMIALDTRDGKLLEDDAIKREITKRQPYKEWCGAISELPDHFATHSEHKSALKPGDLPRLQIAFGYDSEELREIIQPLAITGSEPIGSMGDDTPLAVFSKRQRLLSDYFKQRFAQVTNPPIDSIREKIVMSLSSHIGRRCSWLTESQAHSTLVQLRSPFLFAGELSALQDMVPSQTIICNFDARAGANGFEPALTSICTSAEAAVDAGKTLIILSDRDTNDGNVPIPMLLAVGAVHHHLLRCGKRLRASIVCDTGEARDVHQFACLIGYGASAVHPYLAVETIRHSVETGNCGGLSSEQALANYRSGIESGMLKVMAKMGISTITSYCAAQLFDAIGLSQDVIDRCFENTPSQIGGLTLHQIAEDALRRHTMAFAAQGIPALEDAGNFRVGRNGKGEFHATNPQVVMALHRFNKTGNAEEFFKFLETVDRRPPVAPRDLLQFKQQQPIPLEQVETVETIRRRFTTAGMSLGALSPEAHECLAVAMNSIGGKSNSGEGGEDAERFRVRPNGENANSAIKQVASGRFGVTPAYLVNALELEIKMAQGSKPGEGGQLPGYKVSPLIARLRHCVPGTTLISPPPHHDIYSIEDLAQLIYDLKEINPRAKICVKLVSEPGVGTIAAGIAKAHADVILISGHDGGTGASPLSSIKHAGSPFEFGIAEAHQTLLLNDLRSHVVLRTDGGLKTGRDIVLAAILGAEEFNFGTAALIAAGCAMFRICHTNRCPVGVATQDEELRRKYRGKPENVVAFFNGVAQEVRELLAQLGFHTLADVIGHTELLERRPLEDFPPEIRHHIESLNLDRWLAKPLRTPSGVVVPKISEQANCGALNERIIVDAQPALLHQRPVRLVYHVSNEDRSIGARLSGEISRVFGGNGLADGMIEVILRGSAGQSFGAFLSRGIRLRLIGEANDYVGKGMGGGEIIIRPSEKVRFEWAKSVLLGNTALYGATGGRLFAAGLAGERFCVRNSGGTAVAEGVGDHACEYMTGGMVVVLGRTGRNFAAGMSGGSALVFDADNVFMRCCNLETVYAERLTDEDEIAEAKTLILTHQEFTGSARAAEILAKWRESVPYFWRIVPKRETTASRSANQSPSEKPAMAATPA